MLKGLGFPISFRVFYFQTKLKLIEFEHKFEFKPYALNQNKIMHQHECANIFNLEKF